MRRSGSVEGLHVRGAVNAHGAADSDDGDRLVLAGATLGDQ